MNSTNKISFKLKLKNTTSNTTITSQNSDSIQALTLQNNLDVSKSCSQKNRTFQNMDKNQMIYEINSTVIRDKFWDLYQKKGKIGQGAHSVVYECFEKITRKSYAVKIPQNMDAEKIKGIKESFLILKQLDHPNILKTYNLYIEQFQEKCYLVSEFCDYPDLRSYLQQSIQKGQNISQEQVVGILKKILETLNYLKKKGVCHRDIKPQNILYDPFTGNLKIIDFQLARMKKYEHDTLDLWTDTGSLFYRAPESFNFGYNQTVDTWALGVIAFQMLTGKLPFTSSSVKGTIFQIINKLIDFDTLNISSMAKKFLLGLLGKDPIKRLTPGQALKSPFILKNSCLIDINFTRSEIKGTVQQPDYKNLSQFAIEAQKKLRYYDESFLSTFLKCTHKSNGIIIIH